MPAIPSAFGCFVGAEDGAEDGSSVAIGGRDHFTSAAGSCVCIYLFIF